MSRAVTERPRAAAAAGVVLAVLGLHVAVWRAWMTTSTPASSAAPVARKAAMDVRSVSVAALGAPAVADAATSARAPVALEASALPAAPPRAALLPLPLPVLLPLPLQPPLPDPLASELPGLSGPASPPTSTLPLEAAVAEAALPAPPVYATRLPSPGRWRYRLQRGGVSGEAELHFELPTAESGAAPAYALRLTSHTPGIGAIDWASRGQLDAAGLAPERFALRRKGRDRQAANFQREAGKITFSGPTHAHPLPAGAQDRLSWLLQLTSIVAAAPERFGAGSSVQIYVAGARGDAQVWIFAVEGWEVVEGGLRLLKLVREPARLYDTRAEIWLDPQRQFLPQRLLQTPQGGGPALDLTYEPGTI